MSGRRRLPRVTALLAILLGPAVLAGAGVAAPPGYRWVDDQGGVHFAGSRDQVPGAYRSRVQGAGPAPPRAERRGWWHVATPEGYFKTIDEERCQRIADSATQRFTRTYRCVLEAYD